MMHATFRLWRGCATHVQAHTSAIPLVHVRPCHASASTDLHLLTVRAHNGRVHFHSDSSSPTPHASDVVTARQPSSDSDTTNTKTSSTAVPRKRSPFAAFSGTKLYEDAKRALKESPRTTIRRKSAVPRGTYHNFLSELRAYYVENNANPVVAAKDSRLFTMEDDRRIVELIKEGKGWADIAHKLGKPLRTMWARFQSTLDPRLRFGAFTEEEDAAIHAHVSEHGEGKWTELSTKMGHTRSGIALRTRYTCTLRPDIKTGPWSDDERRRLLEGIVKHGRDWTAVAGHVGTGRTPNDCRRTATYAFGGFDSASAVRGKRFAPDEDARLRIAVERHGRAHWNKVVKDVPGRSEDRLMERYKTIIPKWLHVPYTRDMRASVHVLLRGDGDVESKLAAQFKDLDAAKGWVTLELGMDDGSQVDWARVNGASGAERSAALDAVEKEILPRVTAEEWKEGATAVWVPAWRWERPICAGRRAPIAAVANHPRIEPFVAVNAGEDH